MPTYSSRRSSLGTYQLIIAMNEITNSILVKIYCLRLQPFSHPGLKFSVFIKALHCYPVLRVWKQIGNRLVQGLGCTADVRKSPTQCPVTAPGFKLAQVIKVHFTLTSVVIINVLFGGLIYWDSVHMYFCLSACGKDF